MTENQHNDNLERFFKENLERYSPTPSGDFWARMESSIPPKPSAWKGLATSFRKWAGLGLLLLVGTTVLVLWYRDKQEIERLSKQIAKQQAVASQEADVSKAATSVSNEILPDKAARNGTVNEIANASGVVNATISSPNQIMAFGKKVFKQQPTVANETAANSGLALKPLQQVIEAHALAENAATQLPITEPIITETANSQAKQSFTAANIERGAESYFAPIFIPLTNISVSSLKNHAPSVKHQNIKPFGKPYPRISVESGATTFAMPLSRLFSGDTLYAGRVKPSYSAGLLLHYEISPSFALQGGYHFKNIRTSRMELRYHSVPFIVVHKMKMSRSISLEAETGFVVNKLINMRSYTDGLALRGRKNVWLGWQSSLNLGISMGDHVTLLTGPTVGSAISTVANGKRTWEAGLGLNLRYQF